MTQDEIIEMARQAGFMMENSAAIQAAEIFYKLAVAKECEACADICETLELPEWPDKVRQPLAQAIRARGQG
jgi:hypothetical protein